MDRRHVFAATLLLALLLAWLWLVDQRDVKIPAVVDTAVPEVVAPQDVDSLADPSLAEPREVSERRAPPAPTPPSDLPLRTSKVGQLGVLEVIVLERETRAPVAGARVEFPEAADPKSVARTTDMSGRAQRDDVQPGGLLLRVVPPIGFAVASRERSDLNDPAEVEDHSVWVIEIERGAPLNTLVVEVVPAGRIEGAVTCNGVAATQWSVLLESCADRKVVATTTTDMLGAYLFGSVVPGRYRVCVDGPLDAQAFSAVDACARPSRPPVVEVFEVETEYLDIELGRSGPTMIHGKFVDQADQPAAGVLVTCWSAPADHVLSDELWAQGLAESGGNLWRHYFWSTRSWPQATQACDSNATWIDISTHSRADGTFSFEGLPAGNYQLEIKPSGRVLASGNGGLEYSFGSSSGIVDTARIPLADLGVLSVPRWVDVELDLTFVDSDGAPIVAGHPLADAQLEYRAPIGSTFTPLAQMPRPWRTRAGANPRDRLVLEFVITHDKRELTRVQLDTTTFEEVDGWRTHKATIRVPN